MLSYLDLRRLEIDSLNRDLLSKNEALRANVDVLTSLNAQTVCSVEGTDRMAQF